MKAVVLGGSGFLGLNIIEALKQAGHEVVGTRRRSSNTIFLRRLGIPMVSASLEDPDSLTSAMAGADTVFFAAGHYPRFSVDTNEQIAAALRGADNVVEAMRRARVPRLIYTGSVVTVGRAADGRLARETDGVATAPDGSTYFAVKVALERFLSEQQDVDTVHLLPAGCLGPYDHKVGTGFFVVGLATGALTAWVNGRTNLVDVRDAAKAHVAAAVSGKAGERYILGGHNLTVADLLTQMAETLQVPFSSRELSADEALELATAEEKRCLQDGGRGRPALSREIVDMIVFGQHVDSSKAEQELGLHARPLVETIEDSYRWYQDNGFLVRH